MHTHNLLTHFLHSHLFLLNRAVILYYGTTLNAGVLSRFHIVFCLCACDTFRYVLGWCAFINWSRIIELSYVANDICVKASVRIQPGDPRFIPYVADQSAGLLAWTSTPPMSLATRRAAKHPPCPCECWS